LNGLQAMADLMAEISQLISMAGISVTTQMQMTENASISLKEAVGCGNAKVGQTQISKMSPW
jgi:hypothetical protein